MLVVVPSNKQVQGRHYWKQMALYVYGETTAHVCPVRSISLNLDRSWLDQAGLVGSTKSI